MALHGISALKILLILYINYTLATRLPIAQVPVATWVFNIGILFTNEFGKGYPLGKIAGFLPLWAASSQAPSEKDSFVDLGSFLDGYGGMVPRWEILFKVTVLRLISFNFDFYWSVIQAGGSPLEVCTR